MAEIKLIGRVFFEFSLRTLSGLAIGGSDVGIEIGGVDRTVIRDKLTNRPYIPGSSLRGKMRSLTEKYKGMPQNQRIGQATIHTCKGAEDYAKCEVCRIYGVPAEVKFNTPTRLIVRDVPLTPESVQQLREAHTDLPFTEVKTEVAIDRVTSVANPRQFERVPAGVVFGPAEMVYSIYSGDGCDPNQDVEFLNVVFTGLKLLEDDYLGGLGSRGSGQVRVEGLRLGLKMAEPYTAEPEWIAGPLESLIALDAQKGTVLNAIRQRLGIAR